MTGILEATLACTKRAKPCLLGGRLCEATISNCKNTDCQHLYPTLFVCSMGTPAETKPRPKPESQLSKVTAQGARINTDFVFYEACAETEPLPQPESKLSKVTAQGARMNTSVNGVLHRAGTDHRPSKNQTCIIWEI